MYIPKNRIIPNLYTKGKEYQYKSNNEEYIGHYHKLYTGKFFTGKNPDDKPVLEIIPVPNNDAQWDATPLTGEGTYTAYANNFDGETVPGQTQNMQSVDVYNSLKKVDLNRVFQNPSSYYPQPTEDDYKLGTFQRYFVYRINTIEFTEVDKETYENIKTKNSNWAWKFYDYFSIPWELTGNKEKTYITIATLC